MPINKERIKLWVDALRSGQYKQGYTRLHREDSFCCLGVACEISGIGEWAANFEGIIGYQTTNESGLVRTIGFIPPPVRMWYGLPSGNPPVTLTINENTSGWSLTSVNDDLKRSFIEIADLIEKKYLVDEEAADVS